MTVSSGVMQLVTQLQFIGMMTQIDVPWPTPWNTFTGYLDFTNVRFETIVGADKVPLFSFRMVYILISICVPLAINILLLIIFQPVYIVIWYVSLCLGVVMLIVGLAGMYLPGSVDQSQASPMLFVIVGASLTGGCLLLAAIVNLVAYLTHDGKSETVAFKEELRDMKKCHRVRALRHAAVFIFLCIAGILIMGLLQATFPGGESSSGWFAGSPLFFAIGIALLCLAALAFLYMILNWCRPGRRCVVKATIFFKKHILLLLLTGISASFIPVVSYAVDAFMCTEYQCPVGTNFNPYAKRSSGSYDTSESRYCDPCNITSGGGPTCGLNVSASFSWCPGFNDLRSWRNPDTTCSDEATVYFYLSAIIVLIMYMIGIPALFIRIIQLLTDNIRTRAMIGPVQPEETQSMVWIRQIAAVEPAAASLYDAFKYERRFYALVQLAYRLLVTMTINVATAYSDAAVIIILVLHTLACILVAAFQPYLAMVEQVLAIVLAICNILNATYAIILWTQGDAIPSYVSWIFIVTNGVIPAVALIVTGLYGRIARKRQAEEEEARAVKNAIVDLRASMTQPDQEVSSGDEADDPDVFHASPSRVTEPIEQEEPPATAAAEANAAEPFSEEMTEKQPAPLPPQRLDPDGAASSDSFSESFDRSYDDTMPIMLPSQQREAREARRREQQAEQGDVQDADHPPAGAAATTDGTTTTVNAENKDDDTASDVASEGEARIDAIAENATELTKPEKRRLKRILRKRQSMNDDITNVINATSTDTMNKAFMAMGIFFLIAFGIAFLGLMRASPQNYLVGSSYMYRGKGTVFAGYSTWDEFIGKCCCFPQVTPSPDFDIAERWVCENGKILERGRVSGPDNGLPIRPVCGTAFNDQCRVKENVDTGVVELVCAQGTPAYQQTTSTAREIMW